MKSVCWWIGMLLCVGCGVPHTGDADGGGPDRVPDDGGAPRELDGSIAHPDEVRYELPDLGPVPAEVCIQFGESDSFSYRMSDDDEWSQILRGEARVVATRGPTMDIGHFFDGAVILHMDFPVQVLGCSEPDPETDEFPERTLQRIEVVGANPELETYYDLGPSASGGSWLGQDISVVADSRFDLLVFEGLDGQPSSEGRMLWQRDLAHDPSASIRIDLTRAPASDLEPVRLEGLDGVYPESLTWAWHLDGPDAYASLASTTSFEALIPTFRSPELFLTARVSGTLREGEVDVEVDAAQSHRSTDVGEAIDFSVDALSAPEVEIATGADGSVLVSVRDASPGLGAGVYYRQHCVLLEQEATTSFFSICEHDRPVENVNVSEWVPTFTPDHPISYRVWSLTTNRVRDVLQVVEFIAAEFHPPAGDPDSIRSATLIVEGEWAPR